MEIKAQLDKPYTEKQRMDFIVSQNHQLGYEIKETDTALQSWGLTEEEKQEQEKQARKQEIETKISELEKMSLNDLLNNNETNLKIYQAVINSLKDSIPKLSGDRC